MRTFVPSLLAVFTAFVGESAIAQSTLEAPVGQYATYSLDSGTWANPATEPVSVFETTIQVVGAAWLRVYFDEVILEGDSFLRITSLQDGEAQPLNAAGLAMWSNTTAYFNGDSVSLELVAASGTARNRIVVSRVEFEPGLVQGSATAQRGGSGQCGICGADDRTPTSEDWSCRLMSVGCTASVYTTNSCLVSAGHCITANLVAQFRVPASLSNCSTVNPPVADQFPITSTQQQNAGVGADWSVLRTGTNSLGQRPFQRYGALRRIAPSLASVTNPCSMWGYGLDLTCTRSQTQQISSGAITAVTAASYQFNADVRGGNSGSGLIKDGRIIAVVTHCQTGCPNHGTRVDQSQFVAGRNAVCPACLADVNGDGTVDLVDLTNELSAFGTSFPAAEFDPAFDLNSDNTIDLVDLALMLASFGFNCP